MSNEDTIEGKLNVTDEANRNSACVERSILHLKGGQLNDIATLHEGFNLHPIPRNYLNKRSYIEQLIFHAAMSDALKSSFSCFTIANRYLFQLDAFDVITGIRNLKSLLKLLFNPSERTSIMVHRVANTWLLDEFNIDSFLLASDQSQEWQWLRKFLSDNKFAIRSRDFSREALILRDLYIKFLYHTVIQSPGLGLRIIPSLTAGTELVRASLPAIQGTTDNTFVAEECASQSPCRSEEDDDRSFSPAHARNDQRRNSRSSRSTAGFTESWSANPDDYLHVAKWHLQDLSFLVGSDLAIFGTPQHPCISLKLSPKHESINVLTGADIWLENILNEVPEVAMCYHHEGIVMQEYEIYKTCDLPSIVGFNTSQVYRTVRNLIMFLKRNATQEGHTYWLVKEPGLGVVKLYDLTTICDRDSSGSQEEQGANPFVFPVAVLCFHLAERRWKEFRSSCQLLASRSLTDQIELNEDSSGGLFDALRLIRNCLNLINLAEVHARKMMGLSSSSLSSSSSSSSSSYSASATGLADLKMRAVLLLCQLYLVTPHAQLSISLNQLSYDGAQGTDDITTLSVEDLSSDSPDTGSGFGETSSEIYDPTDQLDVASVDECNSTRPPGRSMHRLLGNMLVDAFKSSDTARLSRLAIGLIASCTTAIPVIPSTPCNPLDYSSLSSHDNQSNTTWIEVHQKALNPLSPSPSCSPSVRLLLPITMLKAYVSRGQNLWNRYDQLMGPKSTHTSEILALCKLMLRYSLPALVVLEHICPDLYCHSMEPSVTHPPPQSTLTCPRCGSPGLLDTLTGILDPTLLIDMLHIASCLFVTAVVSYFNGVLHHRTEAVQSDQNDSVIFQATCAESIVHVQVISDSVYAQPYTTLSPEPFDMLCQWMDTVILVAHCFKRIYAPTEVEIKPSKPHPRKSKSRGAKKKQSTTTKASDPPATPAVKHAADVLNVLKPSQQFGTKLAINTRWWHVLTNVFVTCLRKAHGKLDGEYSERFVKDIERTFLMIYHPPRPMNGEEDPPYLLKNTNESQFYRLLAAFSQQTNSMAEESHWATSFLTSWVKTHNPTFLPEDALVWKKKKDSSCPEVTGSGDGKKKTASTTTTHDFNISAVCLARAMECLVHQMARYESGMERPSLKFHFQMCLDMVSTVNTYFEVSLDDPTIPVLDDSRYLMTVSYVLKQVARYLPTVLNIDSSRSNPQDFIDQNVPRSLILGVLRLRLNHVNLNCHMNNTLPKSQSLPNSTSIVEQSRTAFNWFLDRFTFPDPHKTDWSADSDVLNELAMYLKMVNRLISSQIHNLDVLSCSGLLSLLKDIAFVSPVVDVLHASSLDKMPEFCNETFELSLKIVLYYLLLVVQHFRRKYRASASEMRSSSGKHRTKRALKRAMSAFPTEWNEIIDSPKEFEKGDMQTLDHFIISIEGQELTKLDKLCSLLHSKFCLLNDYFPQNYS